MILIYQYFDMYNNVCIPCVFVLISWEIEYQVTFVIG